MITANPDKAQNSVAVCSKCNRVSYNLITCDKCGTALSADSTSWCYSSDPKRIRLDVPRSTGPQAIARLTQYNATRTTIQGRTMQSTALPTYNLQPVNSVSSTSSTPSTNHSINVQVLAVEVRIGSRKFLPVTPVTFKEDGILFTLKDYTYAPVLLNARAVMKCKANLSSPMYPVLFLFLEGSCMRQMRSIFGLQESEFTPTSKVEQRRCISIFPLCGSENRSFQTTMEMIRSMFDAMVRRYPRSTKILQEINTETALDILQGDESSDAAVNSTTTTETSRQQQQQTAANSQTSTVRITSATTTTTTSAVTSNCSNGLVTETVAKNSSSPPVLVIPNDPVKWQQIQSNLVVGGVYHVLTQNRTRKYCLWNGTQLVPCLVQNTEVQLNSSVVLIGSLRAQAVSQVKVKAEVGGGLFFTIKSDYTGVKDISLQADDIVQCQVCFAPTSIMVIDVTWLASEQIRTKLNFERYKDPVFDPNSSEERRKHIVILLKDVNTDQREALQQIKLQSAKKQVTFEHLDIVKGLRLITEIKLNTKESRVDDYLQVLSKRSTVTNCFCKVLREISEQDNVPVPDDDDVILTEEEIGIKCPYTQQVMKEPVRNKICGHNYERMAISEFINRKKGTARCPYAGCGNVIPLRMDDLIDNTELKRHIEQNHNS